MDLTKLSDQEKSVALAKAMGWETFNSPHTGRKMIKRPEVVFIQDGNLYDPANMALAWRVLNWANEQHAPDPQEEYIADEVQEYMRFFGAWLSILPPDEAQRNILDKILSLAIEAGLVEVE